jgi:serpin B
MRTLWLILVAPAACLAGCMMMTAQEAEVKRTRVDRADLETVVKGDNEFAFDLYGQLRNKDGNLFFSPESISMALAMTYAGARGETADEMAKTLHFTLPPNKLHPTYAALIRELNGEGKKRGYKLSIANALWGQKGEGFKDDFIKLTHDNYGAGLREVDFAHAAEEVRQEINTWVEKQTQDRIKDLLQPGTVDAMTRLVLTNAIYFKGDWSSQFKKDRTREEEFDDGTGTKTKTPLMQQRARFRYFDAGNLQVLEMPYAGKDLSMVVLLPRKSDGLAELEKLLSADQHAGWLAKAREEEVEVTLPKFKTTSKFDLNDQLSALGMKKAFIAGQANFSGMNGREDLYLGFVLHKAYVDVNEEGTEAAAATGVGVKALALPKYPVFRADHPFVFLIRDTHTGGILFLGRLVNPTK